jgi:hypothetical protein
MGLSMVCIHPTEYAEHGKCRPTFGLSSNIDIGFLLPCRGVAIVAPVLAYYSALALRHPSSLSFILYCRLASSFFILCPPSTHDGGTGNSSTFYLHVGGFSESRQDAISNVFPAAHRSTFAVRL